MYTEPGQSRMVGFVCRLPGGLGASLAPRRHSRRPDDATVGRLSTHLTNHPSATCQSPLSYVGRRSPGKDAVILKHVLIAVNRHSAWRKVLQTRCLRRQLMPVVLISTWLATYFSEERYTKRLDDLRSCFYRHGFFYGYKDLSRLSVSIFVLFPLNSVAISQIWDHHLAQAYFFVLRPIHTQEDVGRRRHVCEWAISWMA